MSKQSEQGKENMVSVTIRIDPSLWEQAKERAGLIPLSKIVRILIRKWLAGEIAINQEDIKGET